MDETLANALVENAVRSLIARLETGLVVTSKFDGNQIVYQIRLLPQADEQGPEEGAVESAGSKW